MYYRWDHGSTPGRCQATRTAHAAWLLLLRSVSGSRRPRKLLLVMVVGPTGRPRQVAVAARQRGQGGRITDQRIRPPPAPVERAVHAARHQRRGRRRSVLGQRDGRATVKRRQPHPCTAAAAATANAKGGTVVAAANPRVGKGGRQTGNGS